MSRISIVHLTEKFYNDHAKHDEILKKPGRPHLVLILKIGNNQFAIPFRTSAHRPKTGRIPALDFAKAVVITADYIGSETKIDNGEFKELQDHFHEIEEKFTIYLKHYTNSIKTQTNLNSPEIKYSALQYFIDILLTMNIQ